MKAIRYNIAEEMKKVAQGKKAKLPVEVVLYEGLRRYPAIQGRIAKAFSITADPAKFVLVCASALAILAIEAIEDNAESATY
jgi:hypothetical protein